VTDDVSTADSTPVGDATGDEASHDDLTADTDTDTDTEAGSEPEPVLGRDHPAFESPVPDAESGGGPDVSLFATDALATDPTVEPCTLSGGAQTTCHRITVVGYPVDHDIGPFCPPTIKTPADEAGIWFDGADQYDIDGAFITGLAELYQDDGWLLHDADGNVTITDTPEAFRAAARPNVDPEYQNSCVEGRIEWLDGGEPVTQSVLLPTTPVPAAAPTQSRRHLGVTLNGVVIAAAAPINAILGSYTIAAFDDCGGHINPVDGYHLHGATGCSGVEVEGHAPIIGYALDGYAIHDPVDLHATDAEAGPEDELDWCGGHVTAELGYHYHAAPAAKNLVIGCLAGQVAVS